MSLHPNIEPQVWSTDKNKYGPMQTKASFYGNNSDFLLILGLKSGEIFTHFWLNNWKSKTQNQEYFLVVNFP